MCDIRNCLRLGHHTTVKFPNQKNTMEICDFHCDDSIKQYEVVEN